MVDSKPAVSQKGDGSVDELLTTRQVALELQVSESSVKRWCDLGIIRTQRTAGGHRRIARAGLQEFLNASGSRGINLQAKSSKTPDEIVTQSERLPQQLLHVAEAAEVYAPTSRDELIQRFQQALIAGDEIVCRELIDRWLSRFEGFAQLGDLLIVGAMERIGRMWECGRAEVFEERRSCEICMRLLTQLSSRTPSVPATAPRAIGGALSGDHYTLANRLVELVLREAGWNACSLGGNLPLDSMLVAVRRERPRLLWLSISHIDNSETFVANYNQFYSQLPADLVVAVGGRALTDELRPRIGYTAHCDSLEQLYALAQVISGAR